MLFCKWLRIKFEAGKFGRREARMYVRAKREIIQVKTWNFGFTYFWKNHFSYHFWDDAGGELLNSFKINEQN